MSTLAIRARIGLRRRRRAAVGVMAAVAVVAGWCALTPREPPVRATLTGAMGTGWPLAFSPDGKTLAVETQFFAVSLWDVPTGRLRATIPYPEIAATAAFSHDGRRLAVDTAVMKGLSPPVSVFDVADGRELARLRVDGMTAWGLRFSPDDSSLSVTSIGEWQAWNLRELAWDTATWEPREPRALRIERGDLHFVSPDGRTLFAASSSGIDVAIRDAATGRRLGTLHGRTSATISCLEPFPDGRQLLVGRSDGTVEVWDVASRALRATLRGLPRDVRPFLMNISADGSTIAANGIRWGPPRSALDLARAAFSWVTMRGRGDPRGEVAVWDARTGRLKARIHRHGRPVLSPDGRLLATADPVGVVTLWDLSGE